MGKMTEPAVLSKEQGYGFAGWDYQDPTQPEKELPIWRNIVSCGQTWFFIADSECVEAFSEDNEISWKLWIAFPTQESAKAFLRGIQPDFSFLELGFEEELVKA